MTKVVLPNGEFSDDGTAVRDMRGYGYMEHLLPLAQGQLMVAAQVVVNREASAVIAGAAAASADAAAGSADTASELATAAGVEANRSMAQADRAQAQADRAEVLAGQVDPKEISDIIGLVDALSGKAPLALIPIVAGTDLDTLKTAGRFLVDGPVHGPAAGKLVVDVDPSPDDASVVLQRATTVGTSPPREFLRSLGAGVWTPWGRVRVEPIVVRIAADAQAVAGRHYKLAAKLKLIFPLNPVDCDIVGITNESGLLTCTLSPNGKTFNGDPTDMVVDLPNVTLEFQYEETTGRWWA